MENSNCEFKQAIFLYYSTLHQALSLGTSEYFIGARDYDGDGNFTWLNGDSLSNDDKLWVSNQPNSDGDCCRANFDEQANLLWDGPCNDRDREIGVCERPI